VGGGGRGGGGNQPSGFPTAGPGGAKEKKNPTGGGGEHGSWPWGWVFPSENTHEGKISGGAPKGEGGDRAREKFAIGRDGAGCKWGAGEGTITNRGRHRSGGHIQEPRPVRGPQPKGQEGELQGGDRPAHSNPTWGGVFVFRGGPRKRRGGGRKRWGGGGGGGGTLPGGGHGQKRGIFPTWAPPRGQQNRGHPRRLGCP